MNMYGQQQTKEGQKTNKQLVAIKYSCTTGIDSLLFAQMLSDCFDRVDLLYAKNETKKNCIILLSQSIG